MHDFPDIYSHGNGIEISIDFGYANVGYSKFRVADSLSMAVIKPDSCL